MDYTHDYNARDAQADMDANENAHTDYVWEPETRAETQRADAFDAYMTAALKAFSPESDLDQATRRGPYFALGVELSTAQMISARFGRGARRVRKVA